MPPAFVGFANFSGNLLVSKSKQSLQSKSFLGVSVSSEHPISRGQFTPAGGKSRIVCLSWGVKGGVEKFADSLVETARSIASPGKGILAVDESTKTIGKRLASIGVENTEENRQAYRELLFTCEGLGQYISGAILFEETLYQNARNGKSFVDCLRGVGVIPGIKVDKGLSPLPGGEAIETWCTGLDGLSERAAAYYKQGARFAKWRAVLQISPETPTELCVQENARGLARYAKTVQEQGLVPIIEPEILMDGDHDIERTAQVQEHVLATVYKECDSNGVLLEGSLLKPNMTVPGADCKRQVSAEDIARYTIRTMERRVPSAVPGIMFLSGGMSEEEASVYLNVMNKIQRRGPWSLSFSYGRALQQSCLKSWKGKQENVKAAQEALLARARANSKANLGKYVPGSEPTLDKTGTFEKAYVY
ncbi:fructose-bisphosphate aldolase, class I [Galdieria sulphuraria]|uniref:Fructose-bisphosphate aldolase n=1 Tax=Galdieria sulphuraria TaxID=130081 RepID=M2XQR7_GALSU|nr:fructose-bisphosphate aldolase, class I [Galdieria sulphuraria]EME25973.1 fructose-bisphosphate aldolase, class I [Galdieria sulphuraria]|eukprot:XP_005702493.1 fructose-bisphosphate aldolase, class I [Galdieria sulphuraria]